MTFNKIVGRIFPGYVEFRREVIDLKDIPPIKTKIMLNLADPESALRWWRLPIDGIGLVRMEFTITEHVKAHPMALAHPELIGNNKVRNEIMKMTGAYTSPAEYCIETLGRCLGSLAMIANPKPVIIRMSDFKTNEYATLLGGADFG
jgi:pyruvate,water dikinase